MGANGDRLDITGAETLTQLVTELHAAGIDFALAEVRLPVLAMARRSGLLDALGEERIFNTIRRQCSTSDFRREAAVSSAVATVTPFQRSIAQAPARQDRLLARGPARAVVVLHLLGVDVIGWLKDVWTQIKDVPLKYLVLGGVLQILQTSLNGLAYYGILAYAYPGRVQLWQIITAYAVGVSMNNFLPANIGTFVTLLMFVAIIPGSTFPGVLAAYLVNKIFFTIVGGLVYLYLFLEAGAGVRRRTSAGSATTGRWHCCCSSVVCSSLVILVRIFWRWLKKLWEKAKEGGKILSDPKAFATRVLLPQLGSYAAKVGVIMVFLAAYSIPVTFDSVMSVIGSSSAANMVVRHAGRRRGHAGRQRRRVEQLHDRRHRDRLLPLAAARDHRRQPGVCAGARGAHLRLDGRQAARLAELRRREGQGEGDEGLQRQEQGSSGVRRSGRRRRMTTRSWGEAGVGAEPPAHRASSGSSSPGSSRRSRSSSRAGSSRAPHVKASGGRSSRQR